MQTTEELESLISKFRSPAMSVIVPPDTVSVLKVERGKEREKTSIGGEVDSARAGASSCSPARIGVGRRLSRAAIASTLFSSDAQTTNSSR